MAKIKLSIYLIKDGYSDDKVIVSGLSSMLHYPISDTKGALGNLYIKTSYKSIPPWADFFDSIFDPKKIGLENKSARAILMINIQNRKFCLTFGHAHFLLDKLLIERNFGLKIALNIGGEKGIKALGKTNLHLTGRQTKEQSSHVDSISGFGYDFETDILKSMTAKDEDGLQTFSGRDSISVGADISLDTIREYLNDLFKIYNNDEYKKKFEWVDNISHVRDSDLTDKLDNQLVKGINNNQKFISLAIPEVIKWQDKSGFTYKKSKNPAVKHDISLEQWKKEIVKNNSVELKTLKNKKVNVYDVNYNLVNSWSIYQCLNAEIDYKGKKYVFNDRAWYCIDDNFVNTVKNFYINIRTSNINLPNSGTKKEPEYNKYVEKSNPDYYLCMDFDLIKVGGGHNKIEFCDLITTDKKIVHVKKYGGSSVLSHLFQQGVVSGELFLADKEFRYKVNNKLTDSFKLENPTNRPNSNEYEICFAIMSKSTGDLHIPFFSMVVLKNTVRKLETFGYKVTLKKIDQ